MYSSINQDLFRDFTRLHYEHCIYAEQLSFDDCAEWVRVYKIPKTDFKETVEEFQKRSAGEFEDTNWLDQTHYDYSPTGRIFKTQRKVTIMNLTSEWLVTIFDRHDRDV